MNEQKPTVNNHFVPQGYLKSFSDDDKLIHCYDKTEKKMIKSKTNSFSVQRYLYTLRKEENDIEDNDFFEKIYKDDIDDYIPNIIKDVDFLTKCPLIANPTLEFNNIKDKIARMLVYQLLRTPTQIMYAHKIGADNEAIDCILKDIKMKISNAQFKSIENLLKEILQKENIYKYFILNEITNKNEIERFSTILKNKCWILFINEASEKFITNDNPVCIYDYENGMVSWNNGFNSTTQIFYPLTPTSMIVIYQNYQCLGILKRIYDNQICRINNDDINFVKKTNNLIYSGAIRQIYYNSDNLLNEIVKRNK